MTIDDLSDAQAECLMEAVQLSRNGQAWRMESLKEALRQRGHEAADVDAAIECWELQERGKLSKTELACVQRALALASNNRNTARSVEIFLANEGHSAQAVRVAMGVCEQHDFFGFPRVGPAGATP